MPTYWVVASEDIRGQVGKGAEVVEERDAQARHGKAVTFSLVCKGSQARDAHERSSHSCGPPVAEEPASTVDVEYLAVSLIAFILRGRLAYLYDQHCKDLGSQKLDQPLMFSIIHSPDCRV